MARLRPSQWGTCVICNSGAILYEGDEGDVCEHCASLIGLQAQLDEARAHVDALVQYRAAVTPIFTCPICGVDGNNRYPENSEHKKDCPEPSARQWLEAQDDDSD